LNVCFSSWIVTSCQAARAASGGAFAPQPAARDRGRTAGHTDRKNPDFALFLTFFQIGRLALLIRDIFELRFQNVEMSDFKNGKKRRGKRDPLKNDHPEKHKIRRTVVRLLWRAAAAGLKPLRLPRAHLPHPGVNKTKLHTLKSHHPRERHGPQAVSSFTHVHNRVLINFLRHSHNVRRRRQLFTEQVSMSFLMRCQNTSSGLYIQQLLSPLSQSRTPWHKLSESLYILLCKEKVLMVQSSEQQSFAC